jgi:putative ABC transport system permease protein
MVSPSFFDTVGAPVRRGRAFDNRDGGRGAEVALVNERFAARFFPDQDPIGRRIAIPDDDPAARRRWLTIVGVSPDVRHGNPRDREIPAVAYVPVKQDGPAGATLVVRSRLDPAALVGAVRREVQLLDPDRAVADPQTVDQMLAQSSWPFRVFGSLFAILALIALTLASVGLYAVIAYSVSTRTQEIGVRMALGAGRATVGWLVLRRGLWQLGFGLALGLGGAWAVGKFVLAGIVAQISGTDTLIFVGVPLLLTLVALAACLVPARRAARLDPLAALRNE